MHDTSFVIVAALALVHAIKGTEPVWLALPELLRVPNVALRTLPDICQRIDASALLAGVLYALSLL